MIATAKATVMSRAVSRQLDGKLSGSFERLRLDVVRCLYFGLLPQDFVPAAPAMDEMWELHPSPVPDATHARGASCWQQAYGRPYRYCSALPIPTVLEPLIAWVRDSIDPRLNGVGLNWYDADLGHYMGLHRDVTKCLVKEAPIVTVSFGASRVFRLKPWWPGDVLDILTGHGTVLVIPFETNRVWRHGVLHRPFDTGRRISVTFRAFEEPAAPLQDNVAVSGRARHHTRYYADATTVQRVTSFALMEPVITPVDQEGR